MRTELIVVEVLLGAILIFAVIATVLFYHLLGAAEKSEWRDS